MLLQLQLPPYFVCIDSPRQSNTPPGSGNDLPRGLTIRKKIRKMGHFVQKLAHSRRKTPRFSRSAWSFLPASRLFSRSAPGYVRTVARRGCSTAHIMPRSGRCRVSFALLPPKSCQFVRRTPSSCFYRARTRSAKPHLRREKVIIYPTRHIFLPIRSAHRQKSSTFAA